MFFKLLLLFSSLIVLVWQIRGSDKIIIVGLHCVCDRIEQPLDRPVSLSQCSDRILETLQFDFYRQSNQNWRLCHFYYLLIYYL